MQGSALDIVLLIAAVLFAASGYRQGLVVGALSFIGFFGGGFIGTQVAAPIATRVASDRVAPVVGIFVVLGAATTGQLVAVIVGHIVRNQLRWRSLRLVDHIGGAVVSALAVLLVSWLVATPLASSSYPYLASQIRRSAVIKAVDAVMPDAVRGAYESFRQLLNRSDFPDVFGPLQPTRVAPIQPPDPAILALPAVRSTRPSIVKILGTAPSCSRQLEGSGFVFSPEHVMTNAHVVAGVRDLQVMAGDERHTGRVVLFNPRRDIAVIYVPGLDRTPLRFTGPAAPGTSAVVAGYPLNGPFTAGPARVRGEQRVRGPDIYNDATVTRQVYALRAQVRSGNSGGPLLSNGGAVYGVIFAAAADDPETGFALTAAEVAPDARAGATATQRVGTQTCD